MSCLTLTCTFILLSSWSPRGVLTNTINPARYLHDGEVSMYVMCVYVHVTLLTLLSSMRL